MIKRFLLTAAMILGLATPAAAQLGSVPFTFTPGTTISSANVNTNFATAYSNALNRTGGTMTGTLTSQKIAPSTTLTYDLGDSSHVYNNLYVATLNCTGCVGASALASTAVTPGSYGSSSLIPTFTVDAQGRLTAASTVAVAAPSGLTLTNTYFSSLSGALLTSIPTSAVSSGNFVATLTAGTGLTISAGSGTGNASTPTLGLANTAVSAGSYGNTFGVTNFTVDAQGRLTAASTQTLTLPMLVNYIPAVCQNGVASLGFNTPASNPAVATCQTGTNTLFATADFAAASNLSVQGNFTLPFDWSGAVDVRGKWFSSTTSGNVVWQFATVCVGDGSTSDPAFNTASTVTDATKGVANQQNDFTMTSVTVTGCSAGQHLFWKLSRNAGTGSDTMSGTASLVELLISIRRSFASS